MTLQQVFEAVQESHRATAAYFTKLDGRMDRLEHRMDRLEHRMDRLEYRMDSLEHRMDGFERRLTKLDIRVDDGFTQIAGQFAEANARLARLEVA